MLLTGILRRCLLSLVKKMVSVFDGRSVVVVTDKTPFIMHYSVKTERVTVTFYVQRYKKGDLPVDVSLQALMNS